MVSHSFKRWAPALLGIALVSVITSSPVSAGVPEHSPDGKRHGILAGAAKVRLCTKTPRPGCHARGYWPYGAHVKVLCEKGGSRAVGRYRSDQWYYVENGGRRAYVHSSWVRGEGVSPSCHQQPDAMVLHWAAKRVGRVETRLDTLAWPYVTAQWSGWPAALTQSAYLLGAEEKLRFRGNTRALHLAYQQAGLLRPWDPRKAKVGSMVFWPDAPGIGHTAIYAGRGYVVSTQGTPTAAQPVGVAAVDRWGTPAGWVAPEDAIVP